MTLAPTILDRYVGKYQVGPLLITFTNENGHFMVAPQGQPKFEAKASSENQFFIDMVGAVFTFTVGPDGKAQEVKLQQGPGHSDRQAHRLVFGRGHLLADGLLWSGKERERDNAAENCS